MPDNAKPNKITVICILNICRSPLGERLLAQALSKEKDSTRQLQVVSAGVTAAVGSSIKLLRRCTQRRGH